MLNSTRWIETGQSNSFSHLLEKLNGSDFSLPTDQSDIAVLAVAGPIVDGVYSNPPNIPWDIDLSGDFKKFDLLPCILINDFVVPACQLILEPLSGPQAFTAGSAATMHCR